MASSMDSDGVKERQQSDRAGLLTILEGMPLKDIVGITPSASDLASRIEGVAGELNVSYAQTTRALGECKSPVGLSRTGVKDS